MRRGARCYALLITLTAWSGSLVFALEPSTDERNQTPEAEKWTKIDHTNLFLLDLTAGPATFAAALVAGENGQATGEVAKLHRVLFAPMTSEIIAARANEPTAFETAHDRNILMNPSEQAVIAYFQTATEMREITLRPGEGVAIGKLPRFAFRRFKAGCKCDCDTGEELRGEMLMYCEHVIEGAPADEPCDCVSLETTLCYAYNDDRELLEGTTQRCRSGLVATDPSM